MPFKPLPIFAVKSGTASSEVVLSWWSLPQIALSIIPQSRLSLATGPIWSSEDANATRPKRDTLPYVGLIPVTPQKAAGCLIDPPVSEPSAAAQRSAETAAAEPPEEPPGTQALS